MAKIFGIVLFVTGLVVFLFGAEGAVQFVSIDENPITGFVELGVKVGIATAVLVVVLSICINRPVNVVGAWFMGIGMLVFIVCSSAGINGYFDHSEPRIRTFLINNVDSRNGPKGRDHYAMIQSWWDRTQYIPLRVSKSIHDELIPKKTHIDVAIHKGALGAAYFGRVTINNDDNASATLMEFYERTEFQESR